MSDLKISERAGVVCLEVLVVPRSSRSAVLGVLDGRLKVALAAPPVDGKANAALIEYLAEALNLPRRAVTIARGEGARRKAIEIRGGSLTDLHARIAALCARVP